MLINNPRKVSKESNRKKGPLLWRGGGWPSSELWQEGRNAEVGSQGFPVPLVAPSCHTQEQAGGHSSFWREGKKRFVFFFPPDFESSHVHVPQSLEYEFGDWSPQQGPPGQTLWDFRKGGEFLEEREEGTAMAEKPNVKEGFIPLVHQPEAPTPSPFCLSLQSEHTSSPFCLLLFAGSPAFCLSSDVHRGFSLAFGGSGHVNPPPWAEETKVKWPLSWSQNLPWCPSLIICNFSLPAFLRAPDPPLLARAPTWWRDAGQVEDPPLQIPTWHAGDSAEWI